VNVELVAWVRRLAKSGGARALRESTGFSVSEIARQLGVSPATVSRWERGVRVPGEQDAERWALVLKRMSA
jgi:transcriptional regulator with XRE-family HTH domain